MKKRIGLACLAIVSALSLTGCIKDLLDVNFDTSASIALPVEIDGDGSGSKEVLFSIESDAQVKKYSKYIESVTVKSFTVSLPSYSGSTAVYDLRLSVDGMTVADLKDVDLAAMNARGETISVEDAQILTAIGNNLLKNKTIKVAGEAATKSGKVTAAFNVRCDMSITANPL